MTRQHELSTLLTATSDLPIILQDVLDATMELQGADFGDVQLYDDATETLKIVAHRGVGQAFLDYFETVDANDGSPWALALRSRARTIIEDMSAQPDDAHQGVAAATGYRGVQSTPLFERHTGKPIGMLSTLFRKPYRPSERELRLTDLYARLAADAITFRLAEHRLRESEEYVRLALEAGQIGIWEWDTANGLLKANAAYQALFGLPRQDRPLPNEVYGAQMAPEEIRLGAEEVMAALEKGTDVQLEQQIVRPDGEIRWMISRGRAKGGDPTYMIGVSYDVTERVRAEQASRESEARLQTAVDLLKLGRYSWNPQTNELQWDKSIKAMWGLRADAAIDNDVWRAGIHPDDLARVDAAIQQCTDPRGDGVYDIEYRVIGITDSVERWIATRGQTYFENGKPVSFYGVAIDITERKRADAQLRESEERFRQFAAHSSNVLWIMDVKTRRLDYVSPAYETVWGKPRDTILSDREHWLEDAHQDDRESGSAALERALQGELVTIEYRIVRPDGRVRLIRDTIFPIRDGNGRMQRAGGIAQDITAYTGAQVYVVDADEASRQALSLLLHRAGFSVKAFASGADFLGMAPVLVPGCVVLDIRSPQSGELAILKELKAWRNGLPVIVIGTSHGDVRLAVQAMKAGAAEWLETPYEQEALTAAIASVLSNIRDDAEQSRDAEFARTRIAGMSIRERQVLEGLLAGGTNKAIGQELGISPRTVELYRSSVMERLGVRTLPEAVLLAAAAGVRPGDHSRAGKATRKIP